MGRSREEKSPSGQGMCCPHCADSKFPCVNMEKSMVSSSRKEKAEPENKTRKE